MTAIIHPTPVSSLKAKPIIADQLRPSTSISKATFDPTKHHSFSEYPKCLSLQDIGLSEDDPMAMTPFAVSDPFPLFNEEAMRIMRSEAFTNEVWENCLRSSNDFGYLLRGHCPKYCPFMYDAWKNPKTLSIISKIAGVDLVPVLDVEIGNINISSLDPDADPSKVDDIPSTKWHVDSYPFVCVVMMSDARNMVGGETAIKTGTGDIIKVRGPQMGCAVVLQGRCITHQALAAIGGTERITMISAFRPRDPLMDHSTVLTTIRPITEHSELYFQWTEYRIEYLQDRFRAMMKMLEEQHRAGRPTDVKRLKEFLAAQQEWLRITNDEIVVEG